MSWDADLLCDHCGSAVGAWNYTHNTNRMANEALDRDNSWWRELHGLDGPAGAALLAEILHEFEANPDKYIAMNPENGWGSFARFREVLTEMYDACAGRPELHWEVHG